MTLDVTLDRPIPHNNEAERAVIGAVLTNPNCRHRVDLSTEDFFTDCHREIWSAIWTLDAEGIEIDTVSVKEVLQRLSRLEAVGGHSYVSSLMDGVPDIANVERYAKIVKRCAEKRRWLIFGNNLMRSALDPLSEPEELSALAMAEVAERGLKESEKSRQLVDVLESGFRVLAKQADSDGKGRSLTSGYGELDYANVFRRTFAVLLSPSRHGKTAVATNLADGFARHDHSVQLFTLESTETEVALRWASKTAEVAHSGTQDWSRLSPTGPERSRLYESLRASGRLPIRMSRGIRTIEGIYAECRRLKSLYGLDAAIIDYIQLVKTEDRIRDEEERFAMISQLLLQYAIDLDIHILATSQINKDWQKRPVHRPIDGNPKNTELVGYEIQQEDTKRCAAIAETARIVLTMYRPHLVGCNRAVFSRNDVRDIQDCHVDFRIAKNNENVTNSYAAHFDERLQKFSMGSCADNGCGTRVPQAKQEPMFIKR